MPFPSKEVIEFATATVEFATTVAAPLVAFWVGRGFARGRQQRRTRGASPAKKPTGSLSARQPQPQEPQHGHR
jgi:hypothetical protein